jgi:hypothetical protein
LPNQFGSNYSQKEIHQLIQHALVQYCQTKSVLAKAKPPDFLKLALTLPRLLIPISVSLPSGQQANLPANHNHPLQHLCYPTDVGYLFCLTQTNFCLHRYQPHYYHIN